MRTNLTPCEFVSFAFSAITESGKKDQSFLEAGGSEDDRMVENGAECREGCACGVHVDKASIYI